MAPLPSPDLNWAHSVCSFQSLRDALADPEITAIETDILMGYEIDQDGKRVVPPVLQPILAHPPEKESDLTASRFFHHVFFAPDPCISCPKEDIRPKKHVKLDFKELSAVEPTLEALDDMLDGLGRADLHGGKAMILNADVLPGPAISRPTVDGDLFLDVCLANDEKNKGGSYSPVYSLGWSTDCRSFRGYQDHHIADMQSLLSRHDLESRCAGIVLAVNARVLCKHCKPFDAFMEEHPKAQLLVWTASGEPPISQCKIRTIQHHFCSTGTIRRVGFDCNVAPSPISGWFYDTVVVLASFYWNLKRLVAEGGG